MIKNFLLKKYLFVFLMCEKVLAGEKLYFPCVKLNFFHMVSHVIFFPSVKKGN